MKFLVAAHLPKKNTVILASKGHPAIHTSSLPEKNETGDSEIIRLSLAENRIVISKDNDFYYSQILFNKPYKLVFLRTGNLLAKETIALFEKYCDEILTLLEANYLLELHTNRLFIIK